jgi:hypothetical protein
MSIFLAKAGRSAKYYVLRGNFWDAKARAVRQQYLAYIGAEPAITLEKAREIAKKIGCSLKELQAVNGLKIVDDIAKRAVK